MKSADRYNILFLIDSLGMGGAERLLVTSLNYFDKTYFNLRVCAFNVRDGNPIAEDIQQIAHVPVDLIPVRRLQDPRGLPRLVFYLKKHRVDLLHTQLVTANILGSVAAKLAGVPTVSTQHTLDAPPKGTGTYRRRQMMWWALRHFCDRVIAVSEETRQHHIRMGRLAPAKVVTMYNGIDLSPFSPLAPEEYRAKRAALGLPQDAPVLTTVAVLRPAKGIQYMLEALPMVLEQVPGARYLVVGSGEHESHLKEMVKQRGLADHVIFSGVRSDIPELLAISDIFVLPTLTEALPTVLAEAMAARKPIVVSEVGGVPEMIEHTHNGLLVPPADPAKLAKACLQLLQNSEQAQMMACNGRQVAELRFDVRQQVQQLAGLYQELLTERGR